MKVIRIYTGDDGQSHFTEVKVPMHAAFHGSDSDFTPALGFVFREAPIGASLGFHTAPHRLLAITLSGVAEIECGDGSSFRLGPGDMLLAEDTTGQGHIVREIEGPRHAVNVQLPPDLDLSNWR
ncbi:MAG: hypothetical protein HY875_10635 [Chloroflexi bacterium]|nr:hypothetical protein [Chloroflexota bacterium]